jgi:hypothetical protein
MIENLLKRPINWSLIEENNVVELHLRPLVIKNQENPGISFSLLFGASVQS